VGVDRRQFVAVIAQQRRGLGAVDAEPMIDAVAVVVGAAALSQTIEQLHCA
jgi:hypothetical protein